MSQTQDHPSPAELFEQFFGPAIFRPWAEVLLRHAEPEPGEQVLDLACATGILARQVAPRVGERGRVVGVDISKDMLQVDRSCSDDVEWREGDAQALPFPDDTFDLVLCQQGLQFFPDVHASAREMRRVTRPGGRIAATVWQPLERHPVYRALLQAEADHLEVDVADVARPFVFGGEERLRDVLEQGGFGDVDIVHETRDATFEQPEMFVALTVHAAVSVMPEVEPDAALVQAITRRTKDVLERHRDGECIRFPRPAFVALAS